MSCPSYQNRENCPHGEKLGVWKQGADYPALYPWLLRNRIQEADKLLGGETEHSPFSSETQILRLEFKVKNHDLQVILSIIFLTETWSLKYVKWLSTHLGLITEGKTPKIGKRVAGDNPNPWAILTSPNHSKSKWEFLSVKSLGRKSLPKSLWDVKIEVNF